MLCDDLELIVSELVTNAVRAGSPTVVVSVGTQEGRIVVRVSDEAAGWPEQREATIHDIGGRGLPLVSALSETWGVRMADTGKVVWAELKIPA
jgi:anti-sigma regulatory factor (Ser/Thr protein kinase)